MISCFWKYYYQIRIDFEQEYLSLYQLELSANLDFLIPSQNIGSILLDYWSSICCISWELLLHRVHKEDCISSFEIRFCQWLISFLSCSIKDVESHRKFINLISFCYEINTDSWFCICHKLICDELVDEASLSDV